MVEGFGGVVDGDLGKGDVCSSQQSLSSGLATRLHSA